MSGDFKHLLWKGNKFLNVEQRAAPRCRIHLRRLLCILLTLCEIGKAEQMIILLMMIILLTLCRLLCILLTLCEIGQAEQMITARLDID